MTVRVNPKLVREIEKYGAEDVQKCYHCGNCSAVCSIHDDGHVFPRKPMRLLQMGLERRILSSLDPWLCYYCGECSTYCPRGAEPGETMMSLRRWLTSRYDFTGISRRFYRSWRTELAALIVVAAITAGGFLYRGLTHGDIRIYDGPQAFLPSSVVHVFDWSMAAVLGLLLGVNSLRMWWFTTGSNPDVRPGLRAYLKAFYLLPLHLFTQKRYGDCGDRRPWGMHLGLMISYSMMLVLIMFFLEAMQSGPAIHWTAHSFGYLATAGLLATVTYMFHGRIRKSRVQFRHSHESDWIFLVLLVVVTVTGVVQHVLHRAGSGEAANIAYVVHLAFVVPMLVLEVPFSKWSHLAYRPLAIYLAQVHREAQTRSASSVSATARAA
jgi:ferredoxin